MESIYVEEFNFDSETLWVYYFLVLQGGEVRARVTSIKNHRGEIVPSDSPLFAKSAKRFQGSYKNNKLVLSYEPLRAVGKK